MLRNKYSFVQKVKLALWLIRTKAICKNARIFRFPIEIRGKQNIDFGNQLTTGIGCRLEAFSESNEKTLIFGDNVQINDYVHICSMNGVRIGNDVLMAGHIYISDNSHGYYKGDINDSSPLDKPINREYFISSVSIEDNVWIGEHVIIMPGVTIGKGSIIGANSVVSKSIPPYVISVGTPAKPIKKYNFDSNIWEKIL